MKNQIIGYIFSGPKKTDEDKDFMRIAKKKKIHIIPFDLNKDISMKNVQKKAKKCDLIFNNTSSYLAIELLKMFEEFGIKTLDKSKVFYYIEDKWMLFLKCKEHNIPTPDTILLPLNVKSANNQLKKFNRWPVILKRINGTQGEFVGKAENLREADKLMKKFWENEKDRLPIIAQEFIKSLCYRVTTIDGNIVQTALKSGHGWKATAVYAQKVGRFSPDKELKAIIKKINRISNIKICGIDFLKKGNLWYVIDINAEPAFDFLDEDREKLTNYLFDFLIEYVDTTKKDTSHKIYLKK